MMHIKVKRPDGKRFDFLKSDGSTTHLRLHANTWRPEVAEAVAASVREMNPGVEVKVQAAP